MLKDRLARIPNVIPSPAPEVDILQFNLAGPVLSVQPFCNNAHYWQVYFDANKLIRESFGEAGFPTPEQHLELTLRALQHFAHDSVLHVAHPLQVLLYQVQPEDAQLELAGEARK
jgi:small-conductance mechanosensitive channel